MVPCKMLASPMLVDQLAIVAPAGFSSQRGREESLCSSPPSAQLAVYRRVDFRVAHRTSDCLARWASLSSILDHQARGGTEWIGSSYPVGTNLIGSQSGMEELCCETIMFNRILTRSTA